MSTTAPCPKCCYPVRPDARRCLRCGHTIVAETRSLLDQFSGAPATSEGPTPTKTRIAIECTKCARKFQWPAKRAEDHQRDKKGCLFCGSALKYPDGFVAEAKVEVVVHKTADCPVCGKEARRLGERLDQNFACTFCTMQFDVDPAGAPRFGRAGEAVRAEALETLLGPLQPGRFDAAFIRAALQARAIHGDLTAQEATEAQRALDAVDAWRPSTDVVTLPGSVEDAALLIQGLVFDAPGRRVGRGPHGPQVTLTYTLEHEVSSTKTVAKNIVGNAVGLSLFATTGIGFTYHADDSDDGINTRHLQVTAQLATIECGTMVNFELRHSDRDGTAALNEDAVRAVTAHVAGTEPSIRIFHCLRALFGPYLSPHAARMLTTDKIALRMESLGGRIAGVASSHAPALQLSADPIQFDRLLGVR